jgi:CRP-like cAMP-binding protein
MGIPLSTHQQSVSYDLAPAEYRIDATSEHKKCSSCFAYELSLCAVILKNAESNVNGIAGKPLVASVRKVPARRTISHPNEWSDFVPIICEGWATTSIALPDGRRQILSFLLPGDMFSTASLFEYASGRMVEAVTDVTYRAYKRSELQAYLYEYPIVLEMLTKSWIEEKKRYDQLAIDLGRRTASERIAGIILDLMNRLSKRGMTQDQTVVFPIRQHHIADATGLTPVHVNKILSEFRRNGLIEITNRQLTILDRAGLHHVANMR